MASSFLHFGLTCSDPGKIEDFYCRFFGFVRVQVMRPGADQIVIIRSGSLSLELFQASEKSGLPRPGEDGCKYPGWRHLCFSVDDLEKKLLEIGSAAEITLGPLDLGEMIPGMKICWIADPEGNIIELNQGYKETLI
ncbi:MAG: VOC family protein [Candidatus Wallbacteria bacterium]|nr:VOC family protein [Candidatus Wallbacteria bacterium]